MFPVVGVHVSTLLMFVTAFAAMVVAIDAYAFASVDPTTSGTGKGNVSKGPMGDSAGTSDVVCDVSPRRSRTVFRYSSWERCRRIIVPASVGSAGVPLGALIAAPVPGTTTGAAPLPPVPEPPAPPLPPPPTVPGWSPPPAPPPPEVVPPGSPEEPGPLVRCNPVQAAATSAQIAKPVG